MTLALSGAVFAAGLLAGCGSSDDSVENPTTSGTITTGVSSAPSTTRPPSNTQAPPSAPAETSAPAGGGAQSPTTGLSPVGPSQTVSGGNSATPPPVRQSPSPPTGDNLPGENSGPAGQPGAPGDDN
ncbi:hypothetical protein [Mycolicibacterium arenosum]|uniref:Lipoprotein n=1 Tax=Mycolicibacterium arenosum TaxID=2952157 RepID=A0ABT1M4U5_9MYCO|nr:hypothetical protein [Mycolicibacterium sp. CAU 1645]MCP9272847.1 hypothetical protein [Mycolicibacterium sp. CAU 1645]